jgi:biopolymer transport protein ExbB
MTQNRNRFDVLKWFCCAAVAGLSLAPLPALAWWNGSWSYREKITINAGPTGAGLSADAGRTPVLVRLHDGNFKFSDAKDDGSDLRFVDADDKTPLKFHIESYDGVVGMAFVWVDIPSLKTGGTTDIYAYYGNTNAPVGADSAGTYDPDTALVYHFAERNAPPRDTSANANNATSPSVSADNGMIGRDARFDGSNSIALPVSPSLAVTAGGQWTWSGWIKPAGAGNGTLYARHDGNNGVVIALNQGKPSVTVMANGAPSQAAATDAVAPDAWHHIAVVASNQIILYVDGKPAATLAAGLPALNSTASLGSDNGTANFTGEMDEVAIAKTARSAGFIQAAFAGEGPNGQMITTGQEEENGGLSGGYFGVILRSVTIDGWVVICILMVMAVISITVMANKARYISRVAKANRKFLAWFEETNFDVRRLEALASVEAVNEMDGSVLYRICDAGSTELTKRMGRGSELSLTPQAVASIKANLDRISAYESQKLNAQMVLLTIAISGGPFLGLLGTVVGVMITFAAIAATGDVNINAIAPGIAAALVATVAGLAVAIPALFGYNYLIIRIKDLTGEMHAFTDEFVTRLAEAHPPRSEHKPLAAE